jgi:hypothetical protein
LLWFGIFIVLIVEMARSPRFNLFVLQGMTGKQITDRRAYDPDVLLMVVRSC